MTTPPPNNKSQRDSFLEGEGDAWFKRNKQINVGDLETWQAGDPLIPLLLPIPLLNTSESLAVEVGCGQGLRLAALHKLRNWNVKGIDPSSDAVKAAVSLGVEAVVGTAEQLPFADKSVDLLIFGFCLYLCDRSDLFQIAAEADRVLKPNSWLAILDFWSPEPKVNPYHHLSGIYSYKTDLTKMFTWHPSYILNDHRLFHHSTRQLTDDSSEWTASTLLRRCDRPIPI